MTKYIVRFHTQIEVSVTIDAHDEDEAAEKAWEPAEGYLKTVYGDMRDISANASLDGIGADEIEEQE